MKISDVAQHYLRHWYTDSTGRQEISGAAPSALIQFVVSQPKGTDRSMIYRALSLLAQPNNPPADPTPQMALGWFTATPSARTFCDTILNNKRRPKSFNELVVRAYNAAVYEIVDRLHNFLLSQINKT